jgi:hypothetical protein
MLHRMAPHFLNLSLCYSKNETLSNTFIYVLPYAISGGTTIGSYKTPRGHLARIPPSKVTGKYFG